MALVQNTTTDVTAPSVLSQKDTNDFFYYELGGGLRMYTGTSAPGHAAPVGSLCIDKTAGKLYICTVVTGTWTVVGAQTA